MDSYNSNKLVQMDQIVQKTIDAIEKGKREIFEIAEDSRRECKDLESRLAELNDTIGKTIEKVDKLEKLEKASRYKLMLISKDFKNYNEEDIRKAYDVTKDLQVQVILHRKQEEQLRAQRSDVEKQLGRMRQTLERAEYITSHVASAMNYLKIALTNIDDTILEVQKKDELGVRIIMAQEEERQRVARDIHDGPAQSLTNLSLKTEIIEKMLGIDLEQARKEIRDLRKLVRGSLQEIRRIIFDLRPMSLDDLGLIATLKEYTNRLMNETDIDIILDAYPEHIHVDSLIEVAIFRIIQEALNNVIRHANASQVFINLKIMEDTLIGSVIDNGVGFDTENQRLKHLKDSKLGGFGIYGMKQRAELLKGRLNIKSQPGKGTTLRLEIPLNALGKERVYEYD
ncbi:MAG: sensor histidine kinase [Caldicoprobacterales bacterium]|jgi:two-component system sensor histidine kinase DegS|nr:sensor histidine kinase [Clostridiales bacterium]